VHSAEEGIPGIGWAGDWKGFWKQIYGRLWFLTPAEAAYHVDHDLVTPTIPIPVIGALVMADPATLPVVYWVSRGWSIADRSIVSSEGGRAFVVQGHTPFYSAPRGPGARQLGLVSNAKKFSCDSLDQFRRMVYEPVDGLMVQGVPSNEYFTFKNRQLVPL